LPAETHILLARQFVITNAIEVNVYLCVAPKEVYEAFKAEVKDGFDEFDELVDQLKREVRQ
jgi:sugar-specific transcriptional regulator TrmB